MTASEIEQLCWQLDLVDAETKLYLLAVARSGDHDRAAGMAGLREPSARSARGWLHGTGLLNQDGTINVDRVLQLQGAKHSFGAYILLDD